MYCIIVIEITALPSLVGFRLQQIMNLVPCNDTITIDRRTHSQANKTLLLSRFKAEKLHGAIYMARCNERDELTNESLVG